MFTSMKQYTKQHSYQSFRPDPLNRMLRIVSVFCYCDILFSIRWTIYWNDPDACRSHWMCSGASAGQPFETPLCDLTRSPGHGQKWRKPRYGVFEARHCAIMVETSRIRTLCGSKRPRSKYCWQRWRLLGCHGGSSTSSQNSHKTPSIPSMSISGQPLRKKST